MNDQLTVFDDLGDQRPCRYRFLRYVGKKVMIMIGSYFDIDIRQGVITQIVDEYYTNVRVGKVILVGTPYNISEVIENGSA